MEFDAATGKPVTDQYGRCSDASYYAAGNMLHPADMGDQCYQEGLVTGERIADDLLANHHQQQLKVAQCIPVQYDPKICFTVPACIDIDDLSVRQIDFNIKVTQPVSGTIRVMAGNTLLYENGIAAYQPDVFY